MKNYIYNSYVECERKITEALHFIELEKYQYRMSDIYQRRYNELIQSKEYKRQTKREQTTLTGIYWYCYKQLTNKIIYPIIWKDKLYHSWEKYPAAARDFVRSYSIGLPRIGITKAAFDAGDWDQYAIEYAIEKWKDETGRAVLPWEK